MLVFAQMHKSYEVLEYIAKIKQQAQEINESTDVKPKRWEILKIFAQKNPQKVSATTPSPSPTWPKTSSAG